MVEKISQQNWFFLFFVSSKKNDIQKINEKNLIGPFKSSKIVKGKNKEFDCAFIEIRWLYK